MPYVNCLCAKLEEIQLLGFAGEGLQIEYLAGGRNISHRAIAV